MNIFCLDPDPVLAARMQCDAHVVKMVLESAQLLSVARHAHGQPAPYKPTHAKHPCALWAGVGRDNYAWLHAHLVALSDEYTHRYGRTHATAQHLDALADASFLPTGGTPHAQAMPDQFKHSDPVVAYRAYYRHKAQTLPRFRYTARNPPEWLNNQLSA